MPESLKDTPYLMESEVLSPYAALDPGESYTFCYDWYAAKVPVGSVVVTCSDIGVTCKPLSAELRNGKLILAGSFGIFYKGNMRLALLDGNDDEIKKVSVKLPVTPLRALVLSQTKLAQDIKVPENAEKLAIYLYDTKGRLLGQLAGTKISRN